MKIVVKDNFEVEIIENAFDNMETVDALADLDDGNPFAISRLNNLLFSKEEKKRVYDHLRNEEGRVPMEAFASFITEVMQTIGESTKK